MDVCFGRVLVVVPIVSLLVFFQCFFVFTPWCTCVGQACLTT